MRVRKRHAWSAVLVALFVLPVVKPEGLPGFEGMLDSTLNWPARSGIGGPAAGAPVDPSRPESARERDLEEINARLREEWFSTLDESRQRTDVREALAGLAALPRSLAARVTRAHDASTLRRSVRIDRGEADGVREGLAVVQGAVFLGRVQHVEAHAARVQLLTDRRSRLEVAVRTAEGERAVGYVAGADGDVLRLKDVRAREGLRVRPGDPVLTSNADERVPAGLVVGRVVSVSAGGADAFLEVTVRPSLDLGRTPSVLVVLPPE